MILSGTLLLGLFLVAASAILFVLHYFLYFSLIYFLQIASQQIKTWLIVILIVLPLSFILSNILVNWRENSLTKWFYYLASLWLGIIAVLISLFILAWIIAGLTKIFGLTISWRILGIVILVLTALISGYGIYNADRLMTKQLTIKINNLPPAWKNKTAVQISDIHSGHILGRDFMQEVVDRVNALKPDIIFITGDLFDGPDNGLAEAIKPLVELKAPDGIYFITGNHETYLGTAKTYDLLKSYSIKILRDELVNLNGVQLIGVEYPERMAKKDVAETIKKIPGFNPAMPTILLYHDPVQTSTIAQAGVNLQLSGHTHSGQIFPINFFTYLIYHGYDSGLHQIGNYSIYTTTGVGTWGPKMRLGNRPEVVKINFQ